ncbi:MucBP domain-containing protein [Lacrimispora aerotolerans]|uniref:MucBP domain-containing protein n=1 Tax=Lacrimispora aerotolerans TaxID=36832 RepID=UPI00047E0D61|nr:MucBP domain-containing protein [Lacrimispora aerotolerans]
MRNFTDKKKKSRLIIFIMSLTCMFLQMNVMASEPLKEGRWELIDENWFYFSENGKVLTGWQQINGKWYFLASGLNGLSGKMLTGWQWIDGRCYYLSVKTEENYPEGAMFLNDLTPDGYKVGETGAWLEGTEIIEVPGKGIQTEKKSSAAVSKFISGGGGGGGGGNRKINDFNGSIDEGPNSNPVTPSEQPPETKPDKSESEIPENSESQCIYTIKYMDIADKSILQVVTGAGKEGDTIQIKSIEIDGYRICKEQKDNLILTGNHTNVSVYYQKETLSSPSEAKKISWNLYFIEEGRPDKEVLKGQTGETEEGKELVIDFPETFIGTDRYYYHSLVSSPWSVEVNGNGIQKYYIEYKKGEQIPDEADPDAETKERLHDWLEVAKKADYSITGEYPTDVQVITKTQAEGNERLLNLVSMAEGIERKEIYLIAKDYYPSAGIISQRLPMVNNISELPMEQLTISGATYTVLRVGFERVYDESICVHEYEMVDEVAATCTGNGHQSVQCKKCGKEEIVILPAIGHLDEDYDGVCDICHEAADEVPEAVHYSIGDVQVRNIGDKLYLFRCIDDDYEDAMENNQKLALFLGDSVIRSDIEGTSKKLNFGSNNNYKYSKVREWLLYNTKADFVHDTYIGITNAYMGATRTGSFEQFSESSLLGQSRLFQQLEDRVFILSVDEAIKYKDYLWKFNGSEENNPESQVSAYSKGYYLRTPQDSGSTDFLYGNGIFIVSLVDGNIRPVEVTETSIGIRPVMAIPQR